MEHAYRTDGWHDYYVAVATVAAALGGLIFIGLTLRLDTIVKNPALIARGREAFGAFLNLLVLSMLILVPGQDRHVLGGELVVFGTVLIFLSVVLQGRTLLRLVPRHRARWVIRLIPFNLSTVAVLVAGVSLLIGRYGGLFWLVPTALIYLLRASFNVWALVIQAADA